MSKIIQKRAQRYKKVMYMLLAFTLIVIAIAGYFAYNKFLEYRTFKNYTKNNLSYIQDIEVKKSTIDEIYKKSKKEYTDSIKIRDEKIESIFPGEESLTELTRLLEQFFVDNNFPSNPIALSSLSFGNVEPNENYLEVAFTMSVKGTEDNFFRLLKFISDSGNFKTPYRLMAINNINIVFPLKDTNEEREEESEEIEELNFTLEGKAYFQKSLTE